MFCEKCGREISDTAHFCAGCGARIAPAADIPQQADDRVFQQPQQPAYNYNDQVQTAAPVKKKNSNKGLIIGIACSAAAIVGIGALIFVLSQPLVNSTSKEDKEDKDRDTHAEVVYSDDADTEDNALDGLITDSTDPIFSDPNAVYRYVRDNINLIYNDGKYSFFDGTNWLKPDIEGGMTTIVVNDRGTYIFATSDGDLYMIKGSSIKRIAAGEITSVHLAANADIVYYVNDGNICVYNGSEKKITSVDGSVSSLKVSPDGSAAAWTVIDTSDYDEDMGGYKTSAYGYNGGNAKKLASCNTIYSVSNGGGIIYAQTKSDKLAVCRNLKDEFESIRGCTSLVAVSFDCSQILFYDSDRNKTFLYNTSLKDAISVCSGCLSVIVPSGCYYCSNNFDNFIGYLDGGIYRFTRKGDEYSRYKIVSAGCDGYELSEDGKTIVYLKNEKLYKIDTTNENAEAVTIAKDVYSFRADRSLRNIYYLTTDKTLRYTSGDESSTKAITSDDVRTYIVDPDSGVCTFIYSDALYYSKNGGERQKIKEVKEAIELTSSYVLDGDGRYFITINGIDYIDTKIEK